MDGEAFGYGVDVGQLLGSYVVAAFALSGIEFEEADAVAIMGCPPEMRMVITAQLLETAGVLREASRHLDGRLVQLTGRLP